MKNLVLTAFALVITVTFGLISADATTQTRLTNDLTRSAVNTYTDSSYAGITDRYTVAKTVTTEAATKDTSGESVATTIQATTVEKTDSYTTAVTRYSTGSCIGNGTNYETGDSFGCSYNSGSTYGKTVGGILTDNAYGVEFATSATPRTEYSSTDLRA